MEQFVKVYNCAYVMSYYYHIENRAYIGLHIGCRLYSVFYIITKLQMLMSVQMDKMTVIQMLSAITQQATSAVAAWKDMMEMEHRVVSYPLIPILDERARIY